MSEEFLLEAPLQNIEKAYTQRALAGLRIELMNQERQITDLDYRIMKEFGLSNQQF